MTNHNSSANATLWAPDRHCAGHGRNSTQWTGGYRRPPLPVDACPALWRESVRHRHANGTTNVWPTATYAGLLTQQPRCSIGTARHGKHDSSPAANRQPHQEPKHRPDTTALSRPPPPASSANSKPRSTLGNGTCSDLAIMNRRHQRSD